MLVVVPTTLTDEVWLLTTEVGIDTVVVAWLVRAWVVVEATRVVVVAALVVVVVVRATVVTATVVTGFLGMMFNMIVKR